MYIFVLENQWKWVKKFLAWFSHVSWEQKEGKEESLFKCQICVQILFSVQEHELKKWGEDLQNAFASTWFPLKTCWRGKLTFPIAHDIIVEMVHPPS